MNIFPLKKLRFGYCPICEGKAVFLSLQRWLRDYYICYSCKSIPRNRALIKYLKLYFPNYKSMTIHESSPYGAASEFIKNNCANYSSSHYFPGVPLGEVYNGFRCENLEALTYPDESFDLFITQDVFEHVMNPFSAFKEIARVLKPGGAHMFSVPYFPKMRSEPRAVIRGGSIVHLKEPEYHGNPVTADGSLVTYNWGWDFTDIIYEHSGMATTILYTHEPRMGIDAEFIEIFISRKKI